MPGRREPERRPDPPSPFPREPEPEEEDWPEGRPQVRFEQLLDLLYGFADILPHDN